METNSPSILELQALLLGTGLSFLNINSHLLEKPLARWLNKHTSAEKKLILEKYGLKKEQELINMVDEFAKYSKLQRKINKIDEELKNMSGSKTSNKLMIQLGLPYLVKLILILLLIFLSLYFRYTPVLYLGDKINLTPFTRFICYPNEINHVSFYFWVMCVSAVFRIFKG